MKKVSWQASVFQAAGGSVAPLALVRFLTPSNVLADVWSDRDGLNPVANPIVTDDSGFAIAYLTPDRYNVEITVDNITRTLTDVIIPAEGSLGVVEWFLIDANFTLSPEHTGKTAYITVDGVQITVPNWASAVEGYAVEFVPASGITAQLVVQGTDTVRNDNRLIIGDAALVRSPATDLWVSLGKVTVAA